MFGSTSTICTNSSSCSSIADSTGREFQLFNTEASTVYIDGEVAGMIALVTFFVWVGSLSKKSKYSWRKNLHFFLGCGDGALQKVLTFVSYLQSSPFVTKAEDRAALDSTVIDVKIVGIEEGLYWF